MAANPKSLKNLKPAQPGEVRNPSGKNGSEWLREMREFFAEQGPEGLDKKTGRRRSRLEMVWTATYAKALRGDTQAQKLIIEQMQGRAAQTIELSGALQNGPKVTFMLPPNGRDVVPPSDEDTSSGDDEGASDDDDDDADGR